MFRSVFEGIIRRIEIIASSSIRVESGNGYVAALNFILKLLLQIHPIPDLISGVCIF
jgi:hypothetical protein